MLSLRGNFLQVLVENDILNYLAPLLARNYPKSIKKQACLIVSNISTGSKDNIQVEVFSDFCAFSARIMSMSIFAASSSMPYIKWLYYYVLTIILPTGSNWCRCYKPSHFPIKDLREGYQGGSCLGYIKCCVWWFKWSNSVSSSQELSWYSFTFKCMFNVFFLCQWNWTWCSAMIILYLATDIWWVEDVWSHSAMFSLTKMLT